jgi:hypothetical protein
MKIAVVRCLVGAPLTVNLEDGSKSKMIAKTQEQQEVDAHGFLRNFGYCLDHKVVREGGYVEYWSTREDPVSYEREIKDALCALGPMVVREQLKHLKDVGYWPGGLAPAWASLVAYQHNCGVGNEKVQAVGWEYVAETLLSTVITSCG